MASGKDLKAEIEKLNKEVDEHQIDK